MKIPAVLMVLALPIGAQEVVSLPVGTPRPGASTYRSVVTDDSQLHGDDSHLRGNVAKLIELTGDRERLQKTLPKLLSDARAKMLKQFPSVTPAFGDEWEKRMAARISVDSFLEVTAGAYEKHFTNEEVQDLITVMTSSKEGKPVKASAPVQQKLEAETPAMVGEILGGATELAVKLGGQIGREIEKEHPEYVRSKLAIVPR